MKPFILLLAALTIGLSACEDMNERPTGTLEVVFKARFKSTPLVMFQEINTGESAAQALTFKKLEFFVSNVKAIKGFSSTAFSDVEYVDFASTSTLSKAQEGIKLTFKDLSIASYDQLAFGVGLKDEINSTTPGDYESSSPLASVGNYWASWNSYVLCRIEGDAKATPADNSSGFLYHSGVNGMYQPLTFNRSFEIEENQTTQLVIYLDAEDLFFKSDNTIDVLTENQTHSGAVGSDAYKLAKRAIENLAASLEIES